MFFFIYLIRQLELETFIIVGEQIRKKILNVLKKILKDFFLKTYPSKRSKISTII